MKPSCRRRPVSIVIHLHTYTVDPDLRRGDGGGYVGTLSFSVIPVTVRFVLLCHRERMRGDDKGVVSVSSIPLSLLRRQEWDYTVRVKRAKNQTLYNTE